MPRRLPIKIESLDELAGYVIKEASRSEFAREAIEAQLASDIAAAGAALTAVDVKFDLEVTAVEEDVTTLQSDMTTAESDITTLESEVQTVAVSFGDPGLSGSFLYVDTADGDKLKYYNSETGVVYMLHTP